MAGLLTVQALCSAWLIIRFDGTGDAGDSVMHYLFARYAPVHPELYLDHWAKPLFVLLASPFAQLGFSGMKVFNALCALGSTWLTYRTATALGITRSWTVAVLFMSMPAGVALTFSGLTEPLFALLLIGAVERCCQGRMFTAAFIASWLPFVRSEGLLVLGVMGVYLLVLRRWKVIPMLLTGSAVYALVGLVAIGDALWIFTKIPYARLASSYGSGEWTHFLEQLLYITGVPIYGLFWLGLVTIVVRMMQRRIRAEEVWLVLGVTVVYIVAHTLFWTLGIFHSMGLKRVLIGIAPLLAMIAVRGLEVLTGAWPVYWPMLRKALFIGIIGHVIVFPFTSNPAALDPMLDLKLTNDQRLALKLADRVRTERPVHGRVIHHHPYVNMAFALDPFEPAQKLGFDALEDSLAPGDLVVWENWFAVVEAGTDRAKLDRDPRLKLLWEDRTTDRGREVVYALYEVRTTSP